MENNLLSEFNSAFMYAISIGVPLISRIGCLILIVFFYAVNFIITCNKLLSSFLDNIRKFCLGQDNSKCTLM